MVDVWVKVMVVFEVVVFEVVVFEVVVFVVVFEGVAFVVMLMTSVVVDCLQTTVLDRQGSMVSLLW